MGAIKQSSMKNKQRKVDGLSSSKVRWVKENSTKKRHAKLSRFNFGAHQYVDLEMIRPYGIE